jgi:hypothetical protein
VNTLNRSYYSSGNQEPDRCESDDNLVIVCSAPFSFPSSVERGARTTVSRIEEKAEEKREKENNFMFLYYTHIHGTVIGVCSHSCTVAVLCCSYHWISCSLHYYLFEILNIEMFGDGMIFIPIVLSTLTLTFSLFSN